MTLDLVRIFKTSWFERFTRKNKIDDSTLIESVRRMNSGIVDADLGNGVIKQRLARVGRGLSGGYRIILLVKRGECTFFVYGFSKSDKSNIQKNEEEAFRKLATHMFSLTENHLSALIKNGELVEVVIDEQGI
ncbi:MAG: type II toxin-antitoxin system RelE/ParE family toxin [Alphaproteobacteria bacterium]|nr:type II toxin-antitoxin system RelE/ParE family toxin [Alphaproteobacteria bacterium]